MVSRLHDPHTRRQACRDRLSGAARVEQRSVGRGGHDLDVARMVRGEARRDESGPCRRIRHPADEPVRERSERQVEVTHEAERHPEGTARLGHVVVELDRAGPYRIADPSV